MGPCHRFWNPELPENVECVDECFVDVRQSDLYLPDHIRAYTGFKPGFMAVIEYQNLSKVTNSGSLIRCLSPTDGFIGI
jgi:hypothetical protein